MTMKITLKSTLTSLSLFIVALVFAGCGDTAGLKTHNMGNPKNQNPMSNDQMPGHF